MGDEQRQPMSAERLAAINVRYLRILYPEQLELKHIVRDLLAEADRLRSRESEVSAQLARAIAIVQAMAALDCRETHENPVYTRDVVLHSDDVNVLWIRDQARTFLASQETGNVN